MFFYVFFRLDQGSHTGESYNILPCLSCRWKLKVLDYAALITPSKSVDTEKCTASH